MSHYQQSYSTLETVGYFRYVESTLNLESKEMVGHARGVNIFRSPWVYATVIPLQNNECRNGKIVFSFFNRKEKNIYIFEILHICLDQDPKNPFISKLHF